MISFDIAKIDILKKLNYDSALQLQIAIGLVMAHKKDREVKFEDGRTFVIKYKNEED